jgi:hypothetical protein|tara:strand:- start:4918 stop:5193 length:276 start_codon:yes stop_codon:yes gene_type:complete
MNDINDELTIKKAYDNACAALNASRCLSDTAEQLMFVEIHQQLFKKVGGDKTLMQEWFHYAHQYLDDSPATLCREEKGLLLVAQYLNSISH